MKKIRDTAADCGRDGSKSVRNLLSEAVDRPLPSAVHTAAQHAMARHGDSVLAVLFYGSCLRSGDPQHSLLDFYLLVSDYGAAYRSHMAALSNRVLPPNVYYDECDCDGVRLRSKYNVISLADFRRRCRADRRDIAIWARFSQPAALLYARDAETFETVVDALTDAVHTMLSATLPLCPPEAQAAEVWSRAFDLSYSAELRSELPGKGAALYAQERAHYDRLFAPVLAEIGARPGEGDRRAASRAWKTRRRLGKSLTFLRLVKAAFTFDGGIDYLAWKIARHSGIAIEVTPWQRRHPIIAGMWLFFRLRRRGAFR